MPLVNWREEVAALLAESAKALMRRSDRQAAAELGTALVYLEKAKAAGETAAAELLWLVRNAMPEQETERFRFSPGELEEIRQRGKND